jgi:hypothetical protein
MATVKYPRGLQARGKRLWKSVLNGWDLDPHEQLLLEEAARIADRAQELWEIVSRDGIEQRDHLGNSRVHPLHIEWRQTEIALLRALASLRIPLGGEDDGQARPGRPGNPGAARGVYQLGRPA